MEGMGRDCVRKEEGSEGMERMNLFIYSLFNNFFQ